MSEPACSCGPRAAGQPASGPPAADLVAARRRLVAARTSTAALVAALAREHAGIIEAATATISDDEHDPEGATIAFEREHTAALLARAQDRLADIDRAAARLDDGGYGICAVCQGAIAAARLAARPAASTCIRCAANPASR